MTQLFRSAARLSYLVVEQCYEEVREEAVHAIEVVRPLKVVRRSDLPSIARIIWINTFVAGKPPASLLAITQRMRQHATDILGEPSLISRHMHLCACKLEGDKVKLAACFVRCLEEDELSADDPHLRLALSEVFELFVAQRRFKQCRQVLERFLERAVDQGSPMACLNIRSKLRLLIAHARLHYLMLSSDRSDRREMVKLLILRQVLRGAAWRSLYGCVMDAHGLAEEEIEDEFTCLLDADC